MKKVLILSLIWSAVFLGACTNTSKNTETENKDIWSVNSSGDNQNVVSPEVSSGDTNSETPKAEEQPVVASWVLDITDCSKDENAKIKKTFLISVKDANDPVKYLEKKREAVNLINQCFTVTVQEEYNISETETGSQQWIFERKILESDQIFDKLMFYPNMNLEDYESFMGNGAKYITTDSRNKIIDFYKDMKINGYKQTPSEDENILHWTDIDKWEKVLTLTVIPQWDGTSLIEYNYMQPLDQR